MSTDSTAERPVRVYFLPKTADPLAPGSDELAGAVWLGDAVCDGLQFARSEGSPSPELLPSRRSFEVAQWPSGLQMVRETGADGVPGPWLVTRTPAAETAP